MRLIVRLFARAFLTLAGLAFLTGASLFVVGSYLLTWPLLRLPPRERRLKAGMDVAAAVIGAIIALKCDSIPGVEVDEGVE